MSTFKSQQFTHIHNFMVDGPLKLVMPLFGPIREKEWEPMWNPTIIHTDTELADSRGTIFTLTHGHETASVWYVNQFDYVGHIIEYLHVEPDYQVVRIVLRFTEINKMQTEVEVNYEFTSITEAGNSKLAHIREHHAESMLRWQSAVNRVLKAQSE